METMLNLIWSSFPLLWDFSMNVLPSTITPAMMWSEVLDSGWNLPLGTEQLFTLGDVNIFIELLYHCPRYSVCCISHTRCKQQGIIYVTLWLWKWHQNPFKVINLEHKCRLCSTFLLATYSVTPVKGERWNAA